MAKTLRTLTDSVKEHLDNAFEVSSGFGDGELMLQDMTASPHAARNGCTQPFT
jgi:hypothetical protein